MCLALPSLIGIFPKQLGIVVLEQVYAQVQRFQEPRTQEEETGEEDDGRNASQENQIVRMEWHKSQMQSNCKYD